MKYKKKTITMILEGRIGRDRKHKQMKRLFNKLYEIKWI